MFTNTLCNRRYLSLCSPPKPIFHHVTIKEVQLQYKKHLLYRGDIIRGIATKKEINNTFMLRFFSASNARMEKLILEYKRAGTEKDYVYRRGECIILTRAVLSAQIRIGVFCYSIESIYIYSGCPPFSQPAER